MRKYRANALGGPKRLDSGYISGSYLRIRQQQKPLQIALERFCFYDLFMNSRASGSSCYLVRSVIFFDVCVAIDEKALKRSAAFCGVK